MLCRTRTEEKHLRQTWGGRLSGLLTGEQEAELDEALQDLEVPTLWLHGAHLRHELVERTHAVDGGAALLRLHEPCKTKARSPLAPTVGGERAVSDEATWKFERGATSLRDFLTRAHHFERS